ncbi:MAG: 2-hydroxychromene-2-carboxylate isomerase [Rhodoblastus sp.]|nr:2-hydroxychromene-2-carboxylate isomerase [Rhodoblastus sp.]MCB1525869.1 2-hydroxychromene-2-carboxylate isomerase [Rhodoblastus sp.]MCC2108426.1 2-hydroxychromene-2-carboxylate isomerase [Hyphomicrobiales bacterium]MCO5085426.1 2-hydroxychromene-2-carboxylate isomerase [Methylobacteriaceae bacterium]
MKRAEFFFDFGSPASYLAYTQMDGIAQRTGAEIVWRPMLLGGVFKATGNASPAMVPAKGKWMNADLPRFAERYGVAYNRNPFFPVNTLLMMRGAAAYEGTPEFRPYVDAMFKAMWVDQKNMNDMPTAAGVLKAAGFDPQAFMATAESQDAKDRLKATTEEAVARGVFGAPTTFVGDHMYFGQDRLDFVEQALRAI